MDIRELFLSCRKGDLEKLRELVETREVEVNVRDQWDSTPLYYACLCGHIDTVRYLLENGARCEANSFDGERCLYGALSPEIRHLLRNYKIICSRTIRRELYSEFLRKLLENGEFADVKFVVHGKIFCAHRCILSVRSEYFHEMFTERWADKASIHLNHQLVSPNAFNSVLHYLYTGQFETHVDNVDDVMRLAKHCRLDSLVERLATTGNNAHFFQSTKPGTRVTRILVESPDNLELQRDFSILAEEGLPIAFRRWIGGTELPFLAEESIRFADIVFRVQEHHFFCHRAFFCTRSEYFRTLLRNPLGERDLESETECGHLPVILVRQLSPQIFLYVLSYIYQDNIELHLSTVQEVLIAADICLLPGLKRLCGSFMANYLDTYNVVPAIRTARLFNLPRLEDEACQFIAEHLEDVVEEEEFRELIGEDAGAVAEREAVDSIDIVDNVRFHLTASSMSEAHDKLQLIDSLLDSLSLDA